MSYTTMIKKKNLKKRPSLLEGTIEKLQELISRGGYMPGDKLPSERELVEEFGVSRTVLREAIRSIEASGLVIVYPGKGVFVSEQNIDDLIMSLEMLLSTGQITVENLIEARHFLEPGIAYVAALRADRNDIRKLEQNLEDMRKNIDNGDAFIEADQQFHLNLAVSSRNPILHLMAGSVVESLSIYRTTVYEGAGAPERAISRHADVIEAIRSRDPSRCYSVMEQHILDADRMKLTDLVHGTLDQVTSGLES